MKNYTSVKDISNLKSAIETAFEVKKNPFGFQHLGKNKTMVLVFFNSSLRTCLSTQKLHARRPMALEELTSYKWIIEGEGQVRSK